MKCVYIIKNISDLEISTNSDDDIIYNLNNRSDAKITNSSLNVKGTTKLITYSEILTIKDKVLKIVTEWYNDEHIKKYLLINQINLGFLVELELFPFLVGLITDIKILEKIIEIEKPDKIIAIGNIEYAEYVSKKKNLQYESKLNEGTTRGFFMDKISIKYDFFNRPLGITLSIEKYNSLREKFEKFSKTILKIFQNRTKNEGNYLLLEFNPSIFSDLIQYAMKSHQKLNFLNFRRPAIWNIESFKQLMGTNSEVITSKDFMENKKAINLQITKLECNLEELFQKENKLQELFMIENESYWSMIKINMSKFLKTRGIQAVKESNMAINLFNSKNFDVVLGLNDNLQIEKTIMAIANQKVIPTIILQHGMFAHRHEKDSPYVRINAVLPLVAKYFAVWGKIDYNFTISQGWDEEHVKMIGGPKFDNVFKKTHNIKKTKKILLATTSGAILDNLMYQRYKESIKKTIEIVECLEDYELVVKVHPVDTNLRMIKKIVNGINPSIPIRMNANVDELIESSDIVITFDLSTVILHALIAKKPIIVLSDGKNEIYKEPIFQYDGLVLIQYEKLEEEIKKIITDSKFCNRLITKGNKLTNDCFSNQGNASKKLLEFMNQLKK